MGRFEMEIKYVNSFIDRHGRRRDYLRRPGCKAVPLPGPRGSVEWIEAYLTGIAAAPDKKPRKAAGEAGSFNRLIIEFYASPDFRSTKASSQRVTRGILDRFAAEHGHRRVDQMERKHVNIIIGARSVTPAAANNLLGKLCHLLNFAIANEWRKDNPALGVKRFKVGEHHTWTDEQLDQFAAHWPLGSRERTAFATALYTGQRCSDVAAMTWSDINPERNTIAVVQEKTDARLKIAIHRELRKALEAWPKKHVVIFPTAYGKAFVSNGFGQFMAQAIEAAGLPEECVLHGLRKAAARKLAEAGCTVHEIKSITGHRSLAEIERYTRAAEQERGAQAAMARWEEHSEPGKSTNHLQTQKI